jgi:peptidoglycan/LPS O-acetylase OafA/YrhL
MIWLRFHVNFLSNYIAFSGIFALGALNLAAFPVSLLVNRFTSLIGEISFGMYLVHFAAIYCLSKIGVTALFKGGDLSAILYYLCVVAVTILVSRFLYATVETHGISLGKHVIKRLDAASNAEPEAST